MMNKLIEVPINDTFSVHLSTSGVNLFQDLPKNIQLRIDTLWAVESELRGKHLFNGKMINVQKVEKGSCFGEAIDYKYCLAQMRDPSLEKHLKIRQMALNGMARTHNHVLIGLRSRWMTQHPLFYELVPSGGVDPRIGDGNRIDINKQLLSEFEEETKLDPSLIQAMHWKFVIYDESCFTYELCAELSLDCAPEHLNPTDEYSEFIWLQKNNIEDFLEQHEHSLVPLTRYLLIKALNSQFFS